MNFNYLGMDINFYEYYEYIYIPLNNDSRYQYNHKDDDDQDDRYDNHGSNNTYRSREVYKLKFMVIGVISINLPVPR